MKESPQSVQIKKRIQRKERNKKRKEGNKKEGNMKETRNEGR